MPAGRLMMQNYHLDSGEQIDGSWTNVMTDRAGRYAFEGVAPTGHKIRVLSGNDKELHTTELFGVGVGQSVEQDIRLPATAGGRD